MELYKSAQYEGVNGFEVSTSLSCLYSPILMKAWCDNSCSLFTTGVNYPVTELCLPKANKGHPLVSTNTGDTI